MAKLKPAWAWLIVALPLFAGWATAADRPLYGPPPAWVKPLVIPNVAASIDGSPVQILLLDTQTRLGTDADETYAEGVIRVLSPQGLAAMTSISPAWNPDTETLTFHRLAILRGGKTIDLLAGGKSVTVLRRETNLEMAMLDGHLTATVQPEGLQVGDVLDSAVTISRHDPVFQGRSETAAVAVHGGVAGRIHIREIWPSTKPIRWRATEGLPAPTLSSANGESELLVDAVTHVSPKAPLDAPPRFADVGQLELTQFQNWSEISTLMAPLYAKAASLGPDSPLHAEAERIRRASPVAKTQVEAALRLAQDQVRYLFLGMNFGGYVPAAADITWSRRFGDCKGKTVLLLALLRELGVQAEPALVSTGLGDGLDQRLPRLEVFDHVFVRARVGDRVYWLDATRTGDRDLDDIPLPDFHWVLPVRTGVADLEKVEPRPFTAPAFESLERLDASGGYDVPAAAHVEHIYRGDTAIGWRQILDGQGRADAERSLKEHWRQQISWIEPKTVDFAYDDAHRVMRLTMDGVAKMEWTRNQSYREFDIGDSNLGFKSAFKREPGPHADAPFAVNYPAYDKWTVQITLPNKGAGFGLAGAAPEADTTIAGRRYQRRSRVEGGVVTMVAEEQSLAPEFPASEAEAASAALRALSLFDVFVRGPAGPEPMSEDDVATQPTDAKGFELRGATFMGRREYDRAIADFTEAARLDPGVAKYAYDRGAAHYQKTEDDLALADFDRALRLDPHDTLALMARADLKTIRGEFAGAEKDFAQALSLSSSPTSVLIRRAHAHERAGQFERAVRDYTALLATDPAPTVRAEWLNARCWGRAEWGSELEAAAGDCTEALTATLQHPTILESRGLVRFRLGQYQKAIEDYTAALALSPGRATSLFGRGLAKLKSGQSAEANADLAAARAADPTIDETFARFGVFPPTATRR